MRFPSFRTGTTPARLRTWKCAKKSTPRLAPPEVMMAQLYFDGNQPLGGIVMLERAIRRVPQDPEAYIMLAERAVNERRITEADLLFQKAVKLVELFTENPNASRIFSFAPTRAGRVLTKAAATGPRPGRNWMR